MPPCSLPARPLSSSVLRPYASLTYLSFTLARRHCFVWERFADGAEMENQPSPTTRGDASASAADAASYPPLERCAPPGADETAGGPLPQTPSRAGREYDTPDLMALCDAVIRHIELHPQERVDEPAPPPVRDGAATPVASSKPLGRPWSRSSLTGAEPDAVPSSDSSSDQESEPCYKRRRVESGGAGRTPRLERAAKSRRPPNYASPGEVKRASPQRSAHVPKSVAKWCARPPSSPPSRYLLLPAALPSPSPPIRPPPPPFSPPPNAHWILCPIMTVLPSSPLPHPNEKKNTFLNRLAETYVEDENGCVKKEDIYDEYKSVCERRGLVASKNNIFAKMLMTTFSSIRGRRLGSRSRGIPHYGGLSRRVQSRSPPVSPLLFPPPPIPSLRLGEGMRRGEDGQTYPSGACIQLAYPDTEKQARSSLSATKGTRGGKKPRRGGT